MSIQKTNSNSKTIQTKQKPKFDFTKGYKNSLFKINSGRPKNSKAEENRKNTQLSVFNWTRTKNNTYKYLLNYISGIFDTFKSLNLTIKSFEVKASIEYKNKSVLIFNLIDNNVNTKSINSISETNINNKNYLVDKDKLTSLTPIKQKTITTFWTIENEALSELVRHDMEERKLLKLIIEKVIRDKKENENSIIKKVSKMANKINLNP